MRIRLHILPSFLAQNTVHAAICNARGVPTLSPSVTAAPTSEPTISLLPSPAPTPVPTQLPCYNDCNRDCQAFRDGTCAQSCNNRFVYLFCNFTSIALGSCIPWLKISIVFFAVSSTMSVVMWCASTSLSYSPHWSLIICAQYSCMDP
jgi:hypothetical protein